MARSDERSFPDHHCALHFFPLDISIVLPSSSFTSIMADHQTDDRQMAPSYNKAYDRNEPPTWTEPKDIIVLSD